MTVALTFRPAAGEEPVPAEKADRARSAGQSEDDGSATTFEGFTEVVASRIAEQAAETGRREIVLTRSEIAALPVQTVQDVLAVLPGVGLTRRGTRGVQGDLNLRGSTFEQALVLVNGVRVNNPQTGHHSLDLFLPAAAIERVEVLYGAGSAVHGPDAFGGAVNIVTGAPATSVWLRLGENDLKGGGFSLQLGNGFWVAAEREVHTGFRDNTEAEVNQLAAGWSWKKDRAVVDLTLAVGQRSFGAHAFYSARFPDQRESTAGELLTARALLPLNAVSTLGLRARVTTHRDDFILDRERPEWYRNRHRTDGGLLGVELRSVIGGWDWGFGVEGARDEISSSNLGEHRRERTAVFAELGRFTGPLTLAFQVRADRQEPWGTAETAAIGGSWAVADGWVLRGHWGRSIRVPSFTDLYYISPSRVGNPDLEPERGRSAELGLDRGKFSLTIFERVADPIIDWLLDDDGVWRASNAGRVQTRGGEAAILVPEFGPLSWQRVGVVVLDSTIDVDPESSAYALAHPRLEAVWSGAAALGKAWRGGWTVRFRGPSSGGSWALVDLRLERELWKSLTAIAEASNLLDREITELHGVPLPGRWITVTFSWQLDQPD